jgi:S-formylglutathione hydrolase FrmB
MATLNLRAVMTALANQIDANTSRALACYDLQPATLPQFPCAIVRPADQFVAYHESFGAAPLVDVQLEVVVMAQGTSDIDSQIAVLDMLSAGAGMSNSIIDAISADRTLGGAVENTIVRTASGLSRAGADDGSAAVMAVLAVGIKLRR